MKLASNPETVHSGANNHFQYFATNSVPAVIASGTDKITVRMEAVKCLTCAPDHSRAYKKHGLF